MKFGDFLKKKIDVNELSDKLKKIDKEIEDELENNSSKDYRILIYKKLKNNLTVNETILLATMGFDIVIGERKFMNMIKNIKL